MGLDLRGGIHQLWENLNIDSTEIPGTGWNILECVARAGRRPGTKPCHAVTFKGVVKVKKQGEVGVLIAKKTFFEEGAFYCLSCFWETEKDWDRKVIGFDKDDLEKQFHWSGGDKSLFGGLEEGRVLLWRREKPGGACQLKAVFRMGRAPAFLEKRGKTQWLRRGGKISGIKI